MENISILEISLKLYKQLHSLNLKIPKQDRYTIWQKIENELLKFIEHISSCSHIQKVQRQGELEKASKHLNTIRILLIISREIKIIDNKNYLNIELLINQIGKMLGGWIKNTKNT
ncbi:MAG: four helix bundle protein [Patescibacteria group bacterium]|nr:four helix bundle protein [Patescibacteria group bacterium]